MAATVARSKSLRLAVALMISLAVWVGLRAATTAFVALNGRQPWPPQQSKTSLRARIGVSLTTVEESEEESEEDTKKSTEAATKPKKGPLPSQLEGLSAEEIAQRKAKAMDIWESLKVDVKDEIDRYQTFRMDKFEKFMRADSRGVALMELYKPGTPEYAKFFEEVMGPFIAKLAEEKLKEAGVQVVGVITIVGSIVAFVGYFGTDIVNVITSPFTGFASEFVELYGF